MQAEDHPHILSSPPYVLGKQSQPLDDDEAPPVSSSTAGTEEVQKSFPLDCSELQLHRREMGGCPVHARLQREGRQFSKISREWLQINNAIMGLFQNGAASFLS